MTDRNALADDPDAFNPPRVEAERYLAFLHEINRLADYAPGTREAEFEDRRNDPAWSIRDHIVKGFFEPVWAGMQRRPRPIDWSQTPLPAPRPPFPLFPDKP